MQNVHTAVKEHVENCMENVTKQVMEYTAVIFSIAASGVSVYVIARAYMDKMRRQNAAKENSVRMTDQTSE